MLQLPDLRLISMFTLLATSALAPAAFGAAPDDVPDTAPPTTPYAQTGLAADAYLHGAWPLRVSSHDADADISRAWIEDAADGTELMSVDVDPTADLDETLALVAPATTGPRTFRVVVQDAAGHRSSVERTWWFDVDAPTAIEPTRDGVVFENDTDVSDLHAPQLCWQVGDATSGVVQVVPMIDGQVVRGTLDGSRGCIAAGVTLAAGPHAVTLVVVDGVGMNGRSAPLRFTTSAPVLEPMTEPTPTPAPDPTPVDGGVPTVPTDGETVVRSEPAAGQSAAPAAPRAQPAGASTATAPATASAPTRYRITVRQRAAGAVRRTGRITLRLWSDQRATVLLRADGTRVTRSFGVRANGRAAELRVARGSRLAQRIRAARPGQLLAVRLRVTVLGSGPASTSSRAARPRWMTVRVRA